MTASGPVNSKYGFKLIKHEIIPEIKFSSHNSVEENKDNFAADAYEYIHENSGAKLLYLKNDDPEKSFSISFRTPPKDSTGVFHILEHSVLCGSRKFPVKEPFTNLLKSSMQTFLNAMTFNDKTMYPVATTNEKDLYNLVDVYMDAVLFPNIYKNINIFYQEGGHPTVESNNNNDCLGFNGVVYNEMKGVYSDPESVMYQNLMSNLFPDTCYAYSSGGDPKYIKELKYKDFLAEHARHYRLDNSYIILYGSLNINKMLKFLNEEYLSKADEIIKWRSQGLHELDFNKNFKPRKITKNKKCETGLKQYKMITSKENRVCGRGYVIESDYRKLLASKIILNALACTNEAPLKKALLKEGISQEIDIELLDGTKQAFVLVECKNCKPDTGKNLDKIIKRNVKELLSNKLDVANIKAAISHLEFLLKQNMSNYSNGVDAAINIMGTWLYDDNAATKPLKYIDDINWLKQQLKTNYYNNLIKEIFIDCKHTSTVEIVPIEKETKKHANKAILSPKEAKNIIAICKDLTKFQESPDKQEDIDKIPVMEKSDIGDIVDYPEPIEETCNQIKCFKYDVATHGIAYVNRYYKIDGIHFDDLPYLSILTKVLHKLDTKRFKACELDLISRDKIGSISFSTVIPGNVKNYKKPAIRLAVNASALEENVGYLTEFIDDILINSNFNNHKTIKIILEQTKVALEQFFVQSGHLAGSNRCYSKILHSSLVQEHLSNIEFYKFIKNLLDNYEEKKHKLSKKLSEIAQTIFNSLPTISFAGSSKAFKKYIFTFDSSRNKNVKKNFKIPDPVKQNEAFIIPSNVNYAIQLYDLRLIKDKKYNGSYSVAARIASFDYLWNEVRVKSGAYGSGLTANSTGNIRYYSYRDPNCLNTFKHYDQCAKWLSDHDMTQKDLDNYIISCVAVIDSPQHISSLIAVQDKKIFSKEKFSYRNKIRKQIINTSLEDIKNAGNLFDLMNQKAVKCVFGSTNLKKELKNSPYKFKVIDLFNIC